MSTSHKASLVLSGLAFAVFVINQWIAFIGWHLELTGPVGATVLSLFLAAGLIVQVWKWIEGNRTALDFGINLIMIPAHVYAELTIWFRTQIADIGLPVNLPLYIIGLYWVIGLIEVLVGRLGYNLQMLRGSYQPPDQRIAELELQKAELELRSSNALAQLDHLRAEVDHMKAERERTYEATCDVPDCGWKSDPKPSQKSAVYALRAHQGRAHGNHREVEERTKASG